MFLEVSIQKIPFIGLGVGRFRYSVVLLGVDVIYLEVFRFWVSGFLRFLFSLGRSYFELL